GGESFADISKMTAAERAAEANDLKNSLQSGAPLGDTQAESIQKRIDQLNAANAASAPKEFSFLDPSTWKPPSQWFGGTSGAPATSAVEPDQFGNGFGGPVEAPP